MKEKSNNDSEEENDIKGAKYLSSQFLLFGDMQNYHYPFEKIRSIPIITTANKELFFLYFSENDYKYFENKGNEFFFRYSISLSNNEVRMKKLKTDILLSFLQLFNCINLEERVKTNPNS